MLTTDEKLLVNNIEEFISASVDKNTIDILIMEMLKIVSTS